MEVFVARQPIFNNQEEVFAYELLYRNNEENFFPSVNGDQATADVIINSFLNIGIDELSNGKPCFINFTENLLQLRLPTYFRPRDVVVEILETVEPSQALIEICKELKELGYQIALDDFVFDEQNEFTYQLLTQADIIKVDFLTTSKEMRLKIEEMSKILNIKMLAEKVETREDFKEALGSGYDYFQGYFFAKPTIVSTHDVPAYFHSYYEMIHNLSKTEPSIDIITQLIERDLSLSYKLLKLINSPAYRPKYKINSIRQAIVLLGLIEIQKWIYVLAVREKAVDQDNFTEEMILLCLTRAKMCESVEKLRRKSVPTSGYFMTGMFSLMDTLVGAPMEKVLQDLPLQDDIADALKGRPNSLKEILDLVITVEQADWKAISEKCNQLSIQERDLFRVYGESLNWAKQLTSNESIYK